MVKKIRLGDIVVDVIFKDIKNVHLSVYPPNGRVRISAPSRINIDTLRAFAISRLSWIKQQQKRLREQEREASREYLDRESHYVWGKRYLLKVIEDNVPPTVELRASKILLRIRPGADNEKRSILDSWYREQIRESAPALIEKWESLMGVSVSRIYVQQMKTKWGSCNPSVRSIRLNTELAKKPRACLEYIVVHEMAHILEPTHNGTFVALMDTYLPNWRLRRDQLNQLPVRHEEWSY